MELPQVSLPCASAGALVHGERQRLPLQRGRVDKRTTRFFVLFEGTPCLVVARENHMEKTILVGPPKTTHATGRLGFFRINMRLVLFQAMSLTSVTLDLTRTPRGARSLLVRPPPKPCSARCVFFG